jgi:O-antigen ligase
LGQPAWIKRAEPRAGLLAAAGVLLFVAAPAHRLDLTLVGLLAALVGLLWRPQVAPAVVGLLIPWFGASRDVAGVGISAPLLATLLGFVATLRLGGPNLRGLSTAFAAPIALFLLSALLSLLPSHYLLLSVRELRATVLEPLLFFALLKLWPTTEAPRLATIGFLAGAVVLAASALLGALAGVGGTAAEGVVRVQAWYASPNHLALTLGRAAPFLLALSRRSPSWRASPPWALAVVVGAILASFSLGGWLGLATAALATLALSGRQRLARRASYAVLAGVVVLAALSAIGVMPERLSLLRGTSFLRVELWLSSLAMLRDHLLLGIGPDNFVYLYQQVYLREGGAAEPNLSHPHNWLLHFWLELGLLGLIAFGWMLVSFWRQVRQLASERSWFVAGAAGAMVDLLVHGLMDNSYFLPDLALVFWLTVALVDTFPRSQRALADA